MGYKLAAAAILLTATNAFAASSSCTVSGCAPGDRAITYATKSEPFYACPTRELASYTATVIGLISLQYTLTGSLPNVSDTTGEPEYLDKDGKPNMTRVMLETARHKAGVATFDQAIAMCSMGRNKAKVTIMNVQKDDEVAYVHDAAKNVNYWMPTSNLDKK